MGAAFALSSVLTPFFMGTVVGAVASGNVPAEGNGDAFSSWIAPLPLLTGALFVASGAYLAAVFLVADARRAGEGDLEGYFARRALWAALVAGAFAAGRDLRPARRRPLRLRRAHRRRAAAGDPLRALRPGRPGAARSAAPAAGLRPLAVGAVVAVIWGWGVAQFPYLLPTSLRIDQAAAPGPTLDSVLVVFGVAAVVVLPSLGLLYWLTQRDLLEGEH